MVDTEIIRTIVGIIGNVISFGLFVLAVPSLYRILKSKSVKGVRPDYHLAMMMSCVFWVFYGMPSIHPRHILVLTAYGIGLARELAYLIIILLYANDNKQRDLFKISCNQGVTSDDSSCVSRFINDDTSGNGSTSLETDDAISNYTFSPGGSRYCLPVCDDANCKPSINQLFDSLEAGIKFYSEYGRLCGFTTRRSAEKTRDDTIVSKYVVCSRAGFNEKNELISDRNRKKGVRRRTVSGRCGCNAKIILKFVSNESYRVSVFVEGHNHNLVSKAGRHFLRANREMSYTSRNFMFDSMKVNIGASQSFSFMKELVGGFANVGSTVRDFRNFSRDLKQYVGERDAQMIIEKFKVKKESCESFYYAYDLDTEGHLTKLFWADSIARRNYELYGDAVSFDATFDTNKYNMVFCPFTGVDKHDRCVTFGFALLSKEDIPHFKWAFDHFLLAMGRNPVCIVTDQCPAMKQAIPMSFPATKHRLCMWHIMEKFPAKLGNFICKETALMENMKKYIWSSTIEPFEFERGWKAVLKEFKLEGNRWLWEMYAIRTSWIPAFFRDKPMFGLMRTTSRSESENNFFSQFHRQSDTLCEFYLRFESAMDKQRNETARLNEEGSSALPATVTGMFIEAEAAELYTRPIFYKVQKEMVASGYNMRIQSIGPLVDGIKCYQMKDVMLKDQVFEVKVGTNYAECSCKKFVMCGILCRHAFCALNHFEVVKLPRNLVLNRWSKNAENAPSILKLFGVSEDLTKMENVSLKQTNIWFNFQKSMNKAGVNIDKLNYVDKTVKQLSSDLGDDSYITKKAHLEMLMGPQPSEEITIHAPKACKNKGSGLKRFVSAREKAINKGNKRPRQCKLCLSTVHDARTCPGKNKACAEKDVEKACAEQDMEKARAEQDVEIEETDAD
ncbi:hypothetical protein POM88_004382 [Heracleum sosnowskyi]|uniref:SWIM-type domain-containing protein n=1 Tax=Heracleum sosnowskyi TaxID=360622 RepID=A0AAD8NDE9_9APIA|nr:hypothetical protein POM88_004382 [Heracleum sosnowskyi]